MGRTKGALNKKTIEKMKKDGVDVTQIPTSNTKTTKATKATTKATANTANTTKTVAAKAATVTKEDERNMTKKENINKDILVPVNKNLLVDGFNPDDFKQYYEDGTPYLPFKVQLPWFNMKYPNGKIAIFRPEWAQEKIPNTYVATARVYKDANDPVDAYIAEASAKRGPEKIQETDISIDPYTDVQRAALSLALRLAGFWCSLTKDDITREILNDNSPKNNVESQPENQPETPVDLPTEEQETDSLEEVSTTSEDIPAEENPSVETSDQPSNDEESQDVANSQETTTESDDALPKTEEVSKDINIQETSESKEDALTENNDTPVVSENTSNTEEQSNPETSSDTENQNPTSEETENKENNDENSNTPEAQNTDDVSNNEEAETTSESSTPELTEEQLQEIEELRAFPFSNGYYDGTIGSLEEGRLDNDTNATNLYAWLLTSGVAQKKQKPAVVAATRLAELLHPDWLAENN